MSSRLHLEGRALLVIGLFLGLFTACHRSDESRCARCGMHIDPKSALRSDLILPGGEHRHYDSPRCALLAWRETTGTTAPTAIRVHEFYSGDERDGTQVVFAQGSDVSGPMGADWIPVDPASAKKFADDHSAKRELPLSDISLDVLREGLP